MTVGDVLYARLSYPSELAMDIKGQYMVVAQADKEASYISMIAMKTGVVNVLSGKKDGVVSEFAPASETQWMDIRGLAVSSSRDVYVLGYGTDCVRVIDGASKIVRTIAGKYKVRASRGSADGTLGTQAVFHSITALALDPTERYLYIGGWRRGTCLHTVGNAILRSANHGSLGRSIKFRNASATYMVIIVD